MEDVNVPFVEVHYVTIQKVGDIPIVKGDFKELPPQVQKWVAQMVIIRNNEINTHTRLVLFIL